MKYLYIRLLSIILMIFVLIVPVLAQEVNTARKKSNFLIEGKVKDVATGEPLPFANISIKGTTSGTSSNVDGRFTLLNIPSDTCMLIISNIGYQTYYLRLTPQTKLNNIIIQLSSISNQLDEVVVTAEPDGAFQTNQKISMI